MAYTFVPYGSVVLAADTASMAISIGSNTYTDFVFKVTARCTSATGANPLTFTFTNGMTGGNNHVQLLGQTNSTTGTASADTTGYQITSAIPGTAYTNNPFVSIEGYIWDTNYAAAIGRSISTNSGLMGTTNAQGNPTISYCQIGNSVLTGITLTTSGNFVAGSSFYLYGITKA